MSTFRSYPRHLKPIQGKGLIQCARSGFLRHPKDCVEIDGQMVAKDKADYYGKFGYDHPQDFAQPEIGGDPTPVPKGGIAEPLSKQDLNISDQEVELSIREGRAPRPGF